MPFEIGKTYTFKQNEIVASRETGKLFFQVKDPASATPFKIKPFEFQNGKIPEKLVCIYRGGEVMDQDMASVVPEVYTQGQEYKFRVMLQEGRNGLCSVRDDIAGLTFGKMDLGNVHFTRFQRIKCRVVSTENGYLRLQYIKENEAPRPEFRIENTLKLEGVEPLGRCRLLDKVMKTKLFAEAEAMRRARDPQWVSQAFDVVRRYMANWVAAKPLVRAPWLPRLKALAVNLMEKSVFLNEFAAEERMRRLEELTGFVEDCEDLHTAVEMIRNGRDETFIRETLDSMERTGWLYNPERKMRVMMALFTLRNAYAHTYIRQIFNVIRERHADRRFLDVFGRGFRQMLSIYIGNESKFANPFDRNSLRELIEAIAIELLLTRDEEFPLWNLHRGMLYTFAALIVDKSASPLAEKALEAFTERSDEPLEFDWRDLDDINRMCHARLNLPSASSSQAKASLAVFEGETSRLTAGQSGLTLSPAEAAPDSMLNVLTRKSLLPSTAFKVMLNRRLKEKAKTDSRQLSDQHDVWAEIERSLEDTSAPEVPLTATTPSKPREPIKIAPTVGDEVCFRVTHKDDVSRHLFHCQIEDANFTGRGTITTGDIVLYPVTATLEMFYEDGKPLIFRGKVEGIDPDGTCRLSMRAEVNDQLAEDATRDHNEDQLVEAIVTRVDKDGDKCYCVCDQGYPAIMPIPSDIELRQQDSVSISISSVTYHPKQDKLFINARYEGSIDRHIPEDNYKLVGTWFHALMGVMAVGVYDPSATTSNEAAADPHGAEVKAEPESSDDSQPESYLDTRTVGEMSRLFDYQAITARNDPWTAYNYLAIARALSKITGDLYRSEFLSVKMSLLEALQKFGVDGRVDESVVASLNDSCNKFVRDADMVQRLEVLRVLSTLERPEAMKVELPKADDKSTVASLRRLVISYNLLRGIKMGPVRQQIRQAIYSLLDLEMPVEDVNRVNVKEDQHHEFKESLIFPANNFMQADERRQGREIMEIICGMLNSEGGTLYLGVSNFGVPKGLGQDFVYLNSGFPDYDLADVQDKFSLLFTRNVREQFGLTNNGVALYPEYITMDFEDIADTWIACVNVRPFPGMVRLNDRSVFLRQDSNTLPIKTAKEQMKYEKERRSKALRQNA